MVSMAIAFSTSKLLVLLFLMAFNYFEAITSFFFFLVGWCHVFVVEGQFQVDFGVEIIDASFNMDNKKGLGTDYYLCGEIVARCCLTDRIGAVEVDWKWIGECNMDGFVLCGHNQYDLTNEKREEKNVKLEKNRLFCYR